MTAGGFTKRNEARLLTGPPLRELGTLRLLGHYLDGTARRHRTCGIDADYVKPDTPHRQRQY
jgi:hypothetical protein